MPQQLCLEDKLVAAGNAVDMLRNGKIGKHVHAGVPLEYTNWQDEQLAWRETAVLFDQSHHMTDIYLRGPDAIKLLSDTGVNSFKNFSVNNAKQFVACNYDGYVIGDAILFYLAENELTLVGRASVMNWLQYHAETGDYDLNIERDERTAVNPLGRQTYRFQVQGPNANRILEVLNGGALPELKFFHMGQINIAGRKVRTLKHGMSGVAGLEIWGPAKDSEEIRAAIIEAGHEHGLLQVGSRAYGSNTLESGWIPCPVPAVYSGDKMRPYRQWLPASWYEGSAASIGGSYYSANIEDYYTTPWDLGYGFFVKFDHDFIGREALEKIAGNPKRRKVTLAWNGEDVTRAISSLFQQGDSAKFIDFPQSNYAALPNDKIMKDGKLAGISTFSGYSYNERSMLSLSYVDIEFSKPGTEVILIWGEENGGTSKPTVEAHRQIEIRAIVNPVPYSKVAREQYAEGWRTSYE
jgi:vanillate/3-O-methylgallate O-demethylase